MNRAQMERRTEEIAAKLKAEMTPGTGFTLICFDFGEAGNIAYASTADRSDFRRQMHELLALLQLKTPMDEKALEESAAALRQAACRFAEEDYQTRDVCGALEAAALDYAERKGWIAP